MRSNEDVVQGKEQDIKQFSSSIGVYYIVLMLARIADILVYLYENNKNSK